MTEINAVAVLQEARDRIATPNSWCKSCDAATAEEESCDWDNKRAVKWCAVGSLYKTLGRHFDRWYKTDVAAQIDIAFDKALVPNPGPYYLYNTGIVKLTEYNDERWVSHAEIIEVFNKAIEILQNNNLAVVPEDALEKFDCAR